jgi:hypothetical protein
MAMVMIVLMIAGFGFLISQNLHLRDALREKENALEAARADAAGLAATNAWLSNELAALRAERDGLAARSAGLERAIMELQSELQEAQREIERLSRSAASTAAKMQSQTTPTAPSLLSPKNADRALIGMTAGSLILVLVLIGLVVADPPSSPRR